MSRISDLIEMRFGIGAEIGGAAPAEGALAAMLGRATRRRFRDRPVAEAVEEDDEQAHGVRGHRRASPAAARR